MSRAEMQRDIDDGKFVEWGEYEGHLYGTKIDSIRNVMRTGKMCILDLSPTVLVFISRYLLIFFATLILRMFEGESIYCCCCLLYFTTLLLNFYFE